MGEGTGASAGARRWRLEDYAQVRSLREPAVSPDGTRVAVVVEAARDREDDRFGSLWVADAAGRERPHRLTQGTDGVKSPQWSPDGRQLAFIAARPPVAAWPSAHAGGGEDAKSPPAPKAQVWMFDLEHGGEPVPLTDRAEGVESYAWSPDGKFLAVAARDASAAQAAYLKSIRQPRHPGPWVMARPSIKRDGVGYLDDVPVHLFSVEVATGAERQLTDGPASEQDPRWSPDGAWVLFRSNRTGFADLNRCTDLWVVSADGREVRRLTQGDVSAGLAAFSPDGQHVAFASPLDPDEGYTPARLMVVQLDDATPVADFSQLGAGFERPEGTVPPLAPGADPVENARHGPRPVRETPRQVLTDGALGPVHGEPVWVAEGQALLALMPIRGPVSLVRVKATGGWEALLPRGRVGVVEALAHAGGTTVVVLNRPDGGAELYRADQGALTRLTSFNQEAFRDRAVPHHRWVSFPNPDGEAVDGVLITASNSPERLPLIAVPHGGPQASDAAAFRFDHQYWAGLGYAVLLVNYRGSVSYGAEWQGAIRGDWGPREHADLMAGVDYLVAEGIADPDRLYLTGFSYGGVMTNWAVGHTDRFRAAATEHGMWDYTSMWGHGDTDGHWQDGWGVPWQNPEGYRRSSPMSAADGLATPLLITAGQHDWRCPVAQAEQLYAAAVRRGVPTELVVYPGEHHAWQSQPSRARDRIRRITAWFHRYGGPGDTEPGERSASDGLPE